MTGPDPVVEGWRLPSVLSDAVRSGRWSSFDDAARAAEVFGEEPSPSWSTYSLDEMVGETARWRDESDPAYLGAGENSLAPASSVLIGDLGFDRPIALDFRDEAPCVRFLSSDGRWLRVADSVTELLDRLGVVPG